MRPPAWFYGILAVALMTSVCGTYVAATDLEPGDSNTVGAVTGRDTMAATRAAHASVIQSAEGPAGELAEIRLRLAEAYEELSRENASLNQKQRECEQNDPIARGLRNKLVAAEKELVQLRQSLQSRLEAIEEIQAVELRRKELLLYVQELRQQEKEVVARTTSGRTVESDEADTP